MATSKNEKLSGHQQVVEYLNKLEHPLKKEIEEVRTIVLSANDQITEHIKWNAPSFCFQNVDKVTFNLYGEGYFRLIFHCGAKVRDKAEKGRLFEDPTRLLHWVADDRGMVKFTDMDDVKAKKEKLVILIKYWLAETSS